MFKTDWLYQAYPKHARHGGLLSNSQIQSMKSDQLEDLLASFKTTPCENTALHDRQICRHYHADTVRDRRRNPFNEYYTVDESRTTMETLYHPIVFRTSYCSHGSACPFQMVCAHAHSGTELRDSQTAELDYKQHHLERVRGRPLLSVLSTTPPRRDFATECNSIWTQVYLQPSCRFVELSELQFFLVNGSASLFREVQETALEECLGYVTKRCINDKRQGLLLRGFHLDSFLSKIEYFLRPSSHSVCKECYYTDRVLILIAKHLATSDGRQYFSRSGSCLVQVSMSKGKVIVFGISERSPGTDVATEAVERVAEWVQREIYNSFAKCECCMELVSLDKGLSCGNGHFYCSLGADSCLSVSVVAQLSLSQQAKQHGLMCPVCSDPFDAKDVAMHLPIDLWSQVKDAVANKKPELASTGSRDVSGVKTTSSQRQRQGPLPDAVVAALEPELTETEVQPGDLFGLGDSFQDTDTRDLC